MMRHDPNEVNSKKMMRRKPKEINSQKMMWRKPNEINSQKMMRLKKPRQPRYVKTQGPANPQT